MLLLCFYTTEKVINYIPSPCFTPMGPLYMGSRAKKGHATGTPLLRDEGERGGGQGIRIIVPAVHPVAPPILMEVYLFVCPP